MLINPYENRFNNNSAKWSFDNTVFALDYLYFFQEIFNTFDNHSFLCN